MAETTIACPSPPAKANYDVPYGCANCGWGCVKIFVRGITAPETALCPKCDCRTANKQIALPYMPGRQHRYPEARID